MLPGAFRPETPRSEVRFALFAILYACAALLDHAQLETRFATFPGGLAMGSAVLVLFSPWSTGALALLFVAQAAFYAEEMPDVHNVGFIHLVLASTALAGLVATCIRERRVRVGGAQWLATIAPALRFEMLVVYAWAFWQKLNWGYLDPDGSCAVSLYEGTRDVLHSQFGLPRFLTPPPMWETGWPVIVGSLAVELAMPVLLFVRKTRNVGIAVALGFHVFLGLGHFYAFSAAATAVLLLFAPDELVRRVERRWSASSSSDRRRSRTIAAFALLGVACLRIVYGWHPDRSLLQNLGGIATLDSRFGQYLFPLYVLAYAWTGRSLFARNELRSRELVIPSAPLLLLFPLATVLNGACPYLGLKNEYSFAMYSNLRTEEGRTNHLLAPLLELADYQRDVVRVTASSEPVLAALEGKRVAIPFQELHRRVQKRLAHSGGDFSLTYVRQGKEFSVPSAAADPILGAPLSLVERKLLAFREIPFDANRCCH